jgi:hypothetical protein
MEIHYDIPPKYISAYMLDTMKEKVGHKQPRGISFNIRVALPVSGAIVVQIGYYAVETIDTVDKFTSKYGTV